MVNNEIKILCHADDAVPVAEGEDDLQRLLHQFNKTAKKFNMVISAAKTKTMIISKTPIRYKLVVDDKITNQGEKVNYLGIDISGYGDVGAEVRNQAVRAMRVEAHLNDAIW